MILRPATEHENGELRRAGMAGIQMRTMRPETSMSAWIPALHAGMTQSKSRTKTD